MAVLLLQAAGAYLGGLFGSVGGAIGTAAGALAGYALDRSLLDGTRRIEGPRLAGARPLTAEEGTPLPRIYGTARLGGTVIWGTRLEETKTTRRQGGKGGGPKVTEYAYYGNVALALCEGVIAGVRRVWADGRELDLSEVEMRVYQGWPDQLPDPLIAARQGAGNTPAYRWTAYVVFERLPLADYGNRIPQLQFEVLRPIGDLRHKIRAVALIPGSTEYGLDPNQVTRRLRPGETQVENRHVLFGWTDITASLNELQLLCPNLTDVALVVSWFGDDLRAGHCKVRPGVTSTSVTGLSKTWKVSGAGRGTARLVTSHGGGSAYGGTPTDSSVMAAIAAIRARGLRVTLYPFMMMDVPAGNGLPDPYGGAQQGVYPWRGRITCYPGPGQPGSADKTAAARAQVAAFCGTALPADFSTEDDTVDFDGAADDWGFRRLVLHYAHLAAAAGGVDAFLVGSEMRGLTTLRDDANAFPFVEVLCQLADQVKALLPGASICYGADWTEYFGHQPADGSGDVFFHLDPLWARPSIAAVGIDNYMPLSDWRDADHVAGNPDGATGPYDPAALRTAISSGEGFDWHYASFSAREARVRSPIADGAYAKPWVYRYKDLVGWWSNPHFDRIGGVEQPSSTAWVPRGKPMWFTELGCPAIDKGPNQPNVFVDPKSSESFTPYFSNGGRSDLAVRRYLDAHAAHWDPASPSFDPAGNPVSPIYGGRMLDHQRCFVWCWDARPFPAFPQSSNVWADGANWHLGHWLNGRLEGSDVGSLINVILAEHGMSAADVSSADGALQGYVIDQPGSVRDALDPLVDLFGLAVSEDAAGLTFRSVGAGTARTIDAMVAGEDGATVERVRTPDHELPAEAVLAFRDPLAEFQNATVRSARAGASGRRQHTLSFPGMLEREQATALVADWLRRAWAGRETVSLSVASYSEGIGPGAVIVLPDGGASEFLVTEVEDGLVRCLKARRVDRAAPTASTNSPLAQPPAPVLHAGQPHALFLDLPARTASTAPQDLLRVAIWQRPWRSQVVLASPETTGFSPRVTIAQPADLGALAEALPSGNVEGRVDGSHALVVDLFGAEAESVGRLQLLNGANAAAVRSISGAWEVLQFEAAEEIAPGHWRLSRLLRGQLGTTDAMAAGAEVEAPFVLLNERVKAAGLLAGEIGLELNWRVGPAMAVISDASFADIALAGGRRGRLPLAPVHLRCRHGSGGDLVFSWARRGRLDADDWEAADIPLGEEREEYRIDIAGGGGPVVRSANSMTPGWLYATGAIAADFGGPPAAIDVTVRQLSVAAGWGLPVTRRFML